MSKRAAVVVGAGLAAVAVACGHPDQRVVDQYFGALRQGDTQTLTSFARVQFDQKVDDWKIVASQPESQAPAPLPELLKKVQAHLDQGNPVRSLALDAEEKLALREFGFITGKPAIYIANVDEAALRSGNAYLKQLQDYAAQENADVVPVCAAIEAEIAQLDDADKADFLKDLGLAEPGLNRVIRAAYHMLSLQTYFTAGEKEVRAWQVRKGATAPQAAGVIHTDFERGFIRAETIAYDDYIRYKGEAGARDAGRLRLEGKDYLVQEGDVLHFRFNV